ncbi:MAG: sulfite exporter TauE/SafE family protein [Desulfobacterales bacterium]
MLLLFCSGIAAGMLGGLLGIGGGILIMPILRFVMGLEPAYAAGTCIVAVFFTTLSGSLKHFKLGHIDFRSILPTIISGLLSTLVFSFLFFYVSKKGFWLDVATGFVFLFIALRMIWEGISEHFSKSMASASSSGIEGSIMAKATIGGVAGILPGLLGIGTGAILVPAFAFSLQAPIKIAIGSSLACFSLNAFVSSLLKLFQGFVQINMLVPLCFGTLIGARIGAALNGKLNAPVLKILFGLVFIYVDSKYLMIFGGQYP